MDESKSFTLFLAGSIEQGQAKQWQRRVVSAFKDEDILILNPRRMDWDANWKPLASNKKFREQVEWELDGLETCDAALMYFDPATKSPVSMLETGLFVTDRRYVKDKRTSPGFNPLQGEHSLLHVVCPNGFWRKGNIDIVCERYGVSQYTSLTKAVAAIKKLI